jgi:hypothetical protein
MKERTSGGSEGVQQSHRNEAVDTERDRTCRRRVAMSANHKEGEKQKESTLRIERDALLGLEEAVLD